MLCTSNDSRAPEAMYRHQLLVTKTYGTVCMCVCVCMYGVRCVLSRNKNVHPPRAQCMHTFPSANRMQDTRMGEKQKNALTDNTKRVTLCNRIRCVRNT